MNYTNKEDSIKLKALGLDIGYAPILKIFDIIEEAVPIYTSDQLFEWLRDNPNKIEITTGWIKVTLSTDPSLHKWVFNGITFGFETNLTDMLARAVIWILEQEAK